jgi:site-specific recombinase XerD
VRVTRLKEQPTKRFSGAGSRLAPLKTPKSKRDLELSLLVRDALIEQMERQRVMRKKAGEQWQEQDFIFTPEQADHWHPDTASRVFADLRELAKLPVTVRLHDLRHSFASAMLKKGIHPKLVQGQLGHSRYQTTMEKYSHLIPGIKTVVADTMEEHIADGQKALAASRVTDALLTTGVSNRIQ